MSRFVAVAGRRGRFLVAEPLFERGAPQVGIGRDQLTVDPGAIADEDGFDSRHLVEQPASVGAQIGVVDHLVSCAKEIQVLIWQVLRSSDCPIDSPDRWCDPYLPDPDTSPATTYLSTRV